MHDRVSAQRIVDAHVHWWDLERNYYPWLMDRKHADGESGLSGADVDREHLPADALSGRRGRLQRGRCGACRGGLGSHRPAR